MIDAFVYWPKHNPTENKVVGDFVSFGIWGEAGKISNFASMAVVERGELIAATLYHNWQPEEGVIELTSYSTDKRWLTRKVISCMLSTPLVRLGCQLIVLRVSERNEVMCKIARKFGFTETYIPRLRGRDEGEYIFCLTDDQWAKSRYNIASEAKHG